MPRLILRGGTVADGTGRRPFPADVVVEDGRIAEVRRGGAGGPGGEDEGASVLEVPGCVVAPGFIDMHTHSDFSALALPSAEGKTAQGVTTEALGQCGFSAFPVCADSAADLLRQAAVWKVELDWQDCAGYMERLQAAGSAVNRVVFVGHGTLRSAVADGEARPVSPSEEAKMCELAGEALEQGAAGISAGLVYPPGCYSTTDELVALGRVAAEADKPFAFHIRDEGEHVMEALDEVVSVASRAGCRVHVSHLKVTGPSNWHLMERALEKMEKARDKGLDVTADAYPYIASHTSLSVVLPHWVKEGGQVALVERLRSKGMRERIGRELRERFPLEYWKRVSVSMVEKEGLVDLSGRTVAEIAAERRMEPVEVVMDLVSETRDGISAVFFCMSRDNLVKVISMPFVAVASDSAALPLDAGTVAGKPHPRAFGTFPRVFARFVREEKVLALEEAVRKMTSLPASVLGLDDRGRVEPGCVADLVIFAPDEFSDRASFKEPVKAPVGLKAVMVGGEMVFSGEEGFTGAEPGSVLKP